VLESPATQEVPAADSGAPTRRGRRAAQRATLRKRALVAGVVVLVVVGALIAVLVSRGGHATPAAKKPARVQVFPSPIVDTGPLTRVEVVLDVPTAGLAASAAKRLTAASLTFMSAVPDVPYGQYPSSRILVFDSSARSRTLAQKAAVALGIPNAPILVTDQKTVVTDAIAILGSDYKPS
jgi:hypothetical protein